MKKQIMAAVAACVLLLFPCLAPAAQEADSAPATGAAPAKTAGPAAQESAGQAVHGNPDSKIYHLPSCRYYGSKGASKTFATVEEAQAAGYRPCKTCGGKKGGM